MWQDRRTAEVCERPEREGAEDEVARVTGLLIDPYFSATKIAWVLDHVDGARAAAERGELLCGTIDAWLVWKFSGGPDPRHRRHQRLAHPCCSTTSGRLGPRPCARCSACRARCCPRSGTRQPTMANPRGGARPASADRAVVGDQQGSLMGQGWLRPGQMKATYGTGCFMLLNTGEARPVSRSRLLARSPRGSRGA